MPESENPTGTPLQPEVPGSENPTGTPLQPEVPESENNGETPLDSEAGETPVREPGEIRRTALLLPYTGVSPLVIPLGALGLALSAAGGLILALRRHTPAPRHRA